MNVAELRNFLEGRTQEDDFRNMVMEATDPELYDALDVLDMMDMFNSEAWKIVHNEVSGRSADRAEKEIENMHNPAYIYDLTHYADEEDYYCGW